MKKIATFTSAKTDISCKGITAQAKTANKKVLIGANVKIKELAGLGTTVSLANNFIASAKACKEPYSPTTFGPRRLCTAPKNLRSKTVKNATANNIGSIVDKNFNQAIPAKNNT